MRAVSAHVRRQAVAYLALFVALGGTSVAAVGLANRSITPAKLNPRLFGGYVRAWASVAASGRVVAAGGRPGIQVRPTPPGDYIVRWHSSPGSGCTSISDVDLRGVGVSGPLPGYALAEAIRQARRGEESFVETYNGLGQHAAMPFDVALLCETPR